MAAPYPQVVLFGDSLFQNAAETQSGFSLQAALQAHCIRRYDVVNRGLSGYNTAQALEVLPRIFPPTPAAPMAYLVVLLGANDAALPRPAAADCQHVPLAAYEANLRTILTHPHIQAHRPRKIVVVTPPPLDGPRFAEFERLAGWPSPPSRQAAVTAQYAEAARRAAAQAAASPGSPDVAVVDLWKALMDVAVKRTPGFDAKAGVLLGDATAPGGGQSGYLSQLLTDGLHLSGDGYRVLFEELKPHIEPAEPRQTTAGWVFPEWRLAPWKK